MTAALITSPPSPANAAALQRGQRLIYLMGASGSGKDTLLRLLRTTLQPHEPVLVAHRYITRPSSGDESSVALNPVEFQRRVDLGCFALHWHSHNLHYGIGIEIDAWLAGGAVVVINGSRAYLAQAHTRYPRLTAIEVTTRPDVLAARLRQRGRETQRQIQARLERATRAYAVPATCAVRSLPNNAAPEDAAGQLLTIARALLPVQETSR